MTQSELAQLRLQAWKLLDGWGSTVERPEDDILRNYGETTRTVPHSFQERCDLADRLVAWSLTIREQEPAT